jgi:hypothetical protein
MKASGILHHKGVLVLCLGLLCLGEPLRSGAGASQDTHATGPLVEQLIGLEKSLPDAQKRHDREFYKNTLTDDFVSVGADGKIHPKAEILSDLASTDLNEYRPYNMQVVQLNDGAAVVTYDAIVRMAHYDDETPRYQHISSVWVKQGQDWKLKFQQSTPAQ